MTAMRGFDAAAVRGVYGTFPSGVVAICARGDDGEPVGLVASSFVAVSLDPPIVSISVQHTSTTWPALAGRSGLGLSVLAADQGGVCRRIAGPVGNRFHGLAVTVADSGAVLVDGAAAWLECRLETVVRTGDHDLVLLRVETMAKHADVAPLVFHAGGFHALAAA